MAIRAAWAMAVLGLVTGARSAALLTDDFDLGFTTWVGISPETTVTCQDEQAHQGMALACAYTIGQPNQPGGCVTPVTVSLAGARAIRMWLRTSVRTALVVVLAERDESRYQTILLSPPDTWRDVHLSLDRFRLADDTTDENGRLDLDQIGHIGIADVGFALPGLPADKGRRTIYLDDFEVLDDDAPSAYSADGQLPYMLENFAAGNLSWIALAGETRDDGPQPGLVWEYPGEAQPGTFTALLTPLGPLPRQGATHLLLTLASQRAMKLVVVLQEEKRPAANLDESRYVTVLDIPGGGQETTYAIELAKLTLADDTPDENGRLDVDQVSALILADAEVIFGGATPNTVTIREVELVGR